DKQASANWQMVQGNHETYVVGYARDDGEGDGRSSGINQPSCWTYQQLNGDISAIAAWPHHRAFFAPDGSEVYLTHASRRGNRDSILPHTPIEKVRRQIAPAPSLFLTAHIHHAFIRQVDETLVVNSGSAGQHCYGETRASYAQVTWRQGRWQAQLVHLDYDMVQTDR
ncbi:MAG: metallophosphoesterase family protein, partial [Chloroflexi bacterium]|nr:metallophosphoesterase family protein [Chloroflexota bacterium]